MKLVLVIGSLDRGGSERQIVNFVQTTHPAYAECFVICLSGEGAMASDVRRTGARVTQLGFRGVRSLSLIRTIVGLYRILRRERPDVVYAFLFWSRVLALPIAALAVREALRVSALRTMPSFDRPQNRQLTRLRRFADRFTDGAIANSDALREAWAAASPDIASKIRVVENGVRVPVQEADSGHGSAVIVSVANLTPHKGHATLLRALAELKQLEWRLLLAGDGPERLAIEKLARDYSISSRVEFLGVVSDVSAVFHQADLAVLASDTEGLPNAVLEAMAHGVPVVATAVGGVPELLGSSGAGTVVPVRDPSALGEAIRTYLEDPALRQRAGEIGRREVEEKYSVEAMRDRTLAAFDAFRTAAG